MQPAKHLSIPIGATHFNHGFVLPFEKHIDEERFIFQDGDWRLQSKDPRFGYRSGSCLIKSLETPSNSKRILTTLGQGFLLGTEGCRYIVDLDINPFSFRPAYLFERDIIKATSD